MSRPCRAGSISQAKDSVGQDHITILGGGPAGLAAGYYASKRGRSFTIFEARSQPGGNAVTVERDGFRFDTGAHRFHDKDPHITREIKSLLGSELVEIRLQSHIYFQGRMLDFPLSALSLFRTLSLPFLLRASLDLARARLNGKPRGTDFESATVHKYGRSLSRRFLLDYSEKLWGLPSRQLSVQISGTRLQGLGPRAILRELILGPGAKPAHLEGTFYYPRRGYGEIVERLAQVCGPHNIRLGSAVSTVRHDGKRITSIGLRSGEAAPVEMLLSTIPLPALLLAMDPPPPAEILDIARGLRFRNLLLVALFLDRPQVTQSATVYFPDSSFPFTRLYEPINRSRLMAPAGKTSLCLEFPCYETDDLWRSDKDTMLGVATGHLERIGWIKRSDVIGGEVLRLGHAYPVLEAGFEDKVASLLKYAAQFENLRTIGRNGRFVYKHVHDMLRFGYDIIGELAN